MDCFQRQAADLQSVPRSQFVHFPARDPCDEPPETRGNDQGRPAGQSPQGRQIQMVPMTVADEYRRHIGERVGENSRPMTPEGYRQVAEHGIRKHTHAVEVDEDGRVAEERQPIVHVASSEIETTDGP